MKIRRYKQARRVLNFYKRTFGVHEPYQVMIDGTFCQAALKGKIQIKEQLPKYFGGEVQLVTTKCVISELESLGKELSGAMYVSKRFQQRRCAHTSKQMTAMECIMSLIGEDNPHHYFVATQDSDLQAQLRKLPSVPLLHIVRNTMILEKPSETAHKQAETLAAAKLEPTGYQKTVLDTLNAKSGVSGGMIQRRHKRKIVKGPNPLSVKKRRVRSVVVNTHGGRVESRSKKRRERLRRRKAVELLAQVSSVCTTN